MPRLPLIRAPPRVGGFVRFMESKWKLLVF